jgi:flagellar biosynthesis/type III secretory pathway M-ring protein FliF/YscJ
MVYVILAIVVVLLVAGLVAMQVRRSVNQGAPEAQPGQETPRPGADSQAEGEERDERAVEPARPDRPEDRQLGDAGAQTGRR